MSGTRVPFDLALPFVVAAHELVCGTPVSKRLHRGAALPWRDLGVSEHDLATMWIANQVDTVVPVADVDLPAAPSAGLAPAPSPEAAPARTGAQATSTASPQQHRNQKRR